MHDIASLNRDLLDDLKVDTDVLTSDMDVDTARRVWLAVSFFKKLTTESEDELANRRCLDKFLDCNNSCRDFVLNPIHLFHDYVVNEVKSSFDDIFFRGPELKLDLSVISQEFGLGPGANIECESYDFFTKLYNSTLTRTDDRLYRLYRCAIVDLPLVLDAELNRSAYRGNSIVAGSRLSFVPKTSDISRSICTEPTLNMLFQKGIGSFLERELQRKFKIDLTKQPVLNRKLALLGSIDGSFGTIDLSSASDSISINLVKALLPDYAFRWLMLARSPCTTLPNGEVLRLDMISSMGNAFTFPLQTLIFSSLVTACYRILGIPLVYGKDGPQNFAVFGDDIIVRKDAYSFVVDCLTLFGFSVNESKSFNAGYFRESCGGDFWKGHNIRGVYLKELSHVSHVYSAINRLIRWSAGSGTMLPKTVTRLFGYIGKTHRWFIPYTDGDTEGIKVPLEFFLSTRDSYWDYLLTRRDVPSRIKKSIVKSRTHPHSRSLKANTVDYLSSTVKPKSYAIPPDDKQECGLPGFHYNGSGLLHSMLGGFIRNGRITLRLNEANRTNVRLRSTSSWNWTPAADYNGRDLIWELTAGEYLGDPSSIEICDLGPPPAV